MSSKQADSGSDFSGWNEPDSRGWLIAALIMGCVVVGGGGVLAWLLWFPSPNNQGAKALNDPANDDPAQVDPLPPEVPNGKPTPPKTNPDVWLQKLADAKEQAKREAKDILISFKGSDWCPPCQQMEKEVFARPEFVEKAGRKFVLVKVDFPKDEPAKARVLDAKANEEMQRHYSVFTYPTVLLADALGIPYGGLSGYLPGGVDPYLADLDKLRVFRVRRDELLTQVEQAADRDKLSAAKQALQFMVQGNMTLCLKEHLPAWLKLAKAKDADNRDGHLEAFFDMDWYLRFQAAPTERLPALLKEVEQWKARHGEFKDRERAANVWLEVARGKAELEDFDGAFKCLQEGLKLNPKDPFVRQNLQSGPLALGLGTGTAFAVSEAGHFLTNAHVAGGPGKVFLQLPEHDKLLPAQLLGEQIENDLAVVKVDLPPKHRVAPLGVLQNHVPRRGEEVGVWGYPLGTVFGKGLKLTKGGISALPEAANKNMLLLDVKVNPGNSGSPLCDLRGNVIGIVSARSLANALPGPTLESYGMAVTCADILPFLQAKIPSFKAAEQGSKNLSWEDIDRRISPAVAMVIKARPLQKNPMVPTP